MILSGTEIIRQRELGRIQIDPFAPNQVNPNSYNFRLGATIMSYINEVLDPRIPQPVSTETIPESGMLLYPNKIYLGHTEEIMGSDHFVPCIRGRSSTARMGLFVHCNRRSHRHRFTQSMDASTTCGTTFTNIARDVDRSSYILVR
jgi:dCTP deaminase